MQPRRILLTCLVVALAGAGLAGAALAKPKPGLGEGFAPKPSSKMVLKPRRHAAAVAVSAAKSAPSAPVLQRLSRDPTLSQDYDTAPRVGGLAAQATGGGQCRLACARTYYFCLAQDDGGAIAFRKHPVTEALHALEHLCGGNSSR